MYNYLGISTNNLKNISIHFNDHEIIYIGGVSGSGKSSLAFDTIAAISENEYGCLISDNKIAPKYKIQKYDAVLVAATLKQLNFNVNPRSTIATYFGLYQHLANILGQYTNIPINSFSPNGLYRCNYCNGLGYVTLPDEQLIIDWNKTIAENPFKCWSTSYANFFSQLLHKFCTEQNIDETKKFKDLSKTAQNLLLHSKGKTKYKINYKVAGKTRSKTSIYIGPFIALSENKNDMFGLNQEKYMRSHICPHCHGSRLSNQISLKKVYNNIDVEFMLTQPLSKLEPIIDKIKTLNDSTIIQYACNYLLRFIRYCKKLNIAYLNFSRAICTLSGGELQRLRLIQLLLGKLKNLLIILDEPTSSLNYEESLSIIEAIKKLKANNTIIIVDHNQQLQEIADRKYFLGPKSGLYGGQLITEKEYLNTQQSNLSIPKVLNTNKIIVNLTSNYVNYKGKLFIYEKTLTGIFGCSGIGKSTILRDILPYQLDDYKYISQKPIKANRISTIASYTELLDEIKLYYAKQTKKDVKIFSLTQNGACTKCNGKGIVPLGNFYNEEIFIPCEKCNGTGYNKTALKQCINNLNIYEFLSLTIEEIFDKNLMISKKFNKTINVLIQLGLGHLSLNQKVKTLSGGENQRLKLSKALGNNKTKIYGLDEPTKGLGKKEILNLVYLLYENSIKLEKTFIVSEHNSEFLKLCSHTSELKKDNEDVLIINN